MAKSTLDKALEAADAGTPAPQAPMTTAQSISLAAADAMKNAEKDTFKLHQTLIAEERVKVQLAPMYRPYFGKIMAVGLGGIYIYFPVDGRSYPVPKSFAAIIHARRRAVDAHIMRKNRLADVQNNFESYAGELKLV